MESCCISTRRPSPSAARLRVLHTRKPPAAAPGILFFACSSAKRSERKKMFVFGMGFVGLHVSRKLRQEGWEVSGTCTSEEKKRTLEEMGFDAFVFNDSENDLENLSNLTLSTHLLLSIPPAPNRGDPLLLLEEDLKCKFSGGNLQWLGYLSSTSVYGDCRGAFVDEDYQPEPAIPAARARLAAEQAWINLGCDLGASSYVFRLGGIYGPGRSALDTIIKRESLSKYQKTRESRKYTARIHVDDIYQAITNSFTMSRTRRVYNVVDDDPAPRSEVFSFAEDLIEEKWPGKIRKDRREDYKGIKREKADIKGEKRVLNTRLKEELRVNLIHPSYKSGLGSIIDSWK